MWSFSYSYWKLALALSALSFILQAAAVPDAWHMDVIPILATEELDPVLSINVQGTHMHKIFGGNNFRAGYNYDLYNAASCTTCSITADKSNYWAPELYWYDANATNPYTPLRASFRFYYQLPRNSPNQYVTAFPKGFRMISGSINTKVITANIKIFCRISTGLDAITCNGFQCGRDCPWGVKMEVWFPNCWDGVNLWTKDMSHVTYPAIVNLADGNGNPRDGSCPWSHPIRIPTIMIEAVYWPSDIHPNVTVDDHLIWAFGDTTGFGGHADFVNGWDVDVLAAALIASGTCVDVYTEITIESCPVFAPYVNLAAAKTCTPAVGVLTESFGNADLVSIPRLPGCNLPWSTGAKPTCNPAPAPLNVAAFTTTDGAYTVPDDERMNFTWPTTSGWHNIGCFVTRTAFDNTTMWSYVDSSLTIERCQASCLTGGYSFAAVGQRSGAWFCSCGNGILDNAQVYPNMCTTACPGNSSETCGANLADDVWWAGPNATTGSLDTQFYEGCLQDSTNGLRYHATYNYTSSKMTVESCTQACANLNATWALPHTGSYCFCGSDKTLYDGGLVPDSYCSTACSGNSTEKCGGGAYGSLYNITNSDLKASTATHPAGWIGCYARPASGLPLTNSTVTTNSMTVTKCVDGCHQLGQSYAALLLGTTCECGNTPNLGLPLPVSECNTACIGNTSQTCGGSNPLELYDANASTLNLATVTSKHPAGWLGCYLNSATSLAFGSSNYSFTNSLMTESLCQSGCLQLSYAYAGAVGTTCYCSKTGPTTMAVPYYTCGVSCAGNTTQTCGAAGYMDVLSTTAVATSTNSTTGSTAAAYKGCYQDTGLTGLTGYNFKLAAMTVEKCGSGCHEIGYSLAGLTGGSTCYCGNTWAGGQVLPITSCATPCSGNSTEMCGGSSIQSLYTATDFAVPAKASTWKGCYLDSTTTRVLSALSWASATQTIELCQTSCANAGYTYAGVESVNYCYCDTTLHTTSTAVPSVLCQTTACSGNSTEWCGGSSYVGIYQASAVVTNGVAGFMGCYTDGVTALTTYTFTSDAMTIQACEQMCVLKGTKYAGIRGGNLCQCGNTAPHLILAPSTCSTPCTGNSSQSCGISSYMSVFDLAETTATSSIDASYNATGYIGCFAAGTAFPLTTNTLSLAAMTTEICLASCSQFGYAYAGTYQGTQCYCGASLNSASAAYRVQIADCSVRCGGNKNEFCGAGALMSIWNVAASGATAPSTSSIEGYTGCYSNSATFFTTAGYVTNSSAVDSSICRRSCRNRGYTVAGLNAGRDCGCSNSTNYGSVSALAGCSVACANNASQICGGTGTFLSVYDTTGAGSLPPSTGYPTGYVGCFTTDTTVGTLTLSSAAMTIELCQSTCGAKAFTVANVYNQACYCANTLPTGVQWPESYCSMPCPGNAAEVCGFSGSKISSYRVSAVQAAALSIAAAPASSSSSAPASASSSSVASSVASSSASVSASSVSISKASSSSVAVSASSSSTISSSSTASSAAAAASSSSSASKASSASSASAAAASSSAAKAKRDKLGGYRHRPDMVH